MSNPVSALVGWLRQQEPDVQEDIAFHMLMANPIFNGKELIRRNSMDHDKRLTSFYDRINEFSGNEIENPGFVIAFKAIIEFGIMKKRSSAKGWERFQWLNEKLIDDSEVPENMKMDARTQLSRLPDLKDKWKLINRSWENLVSGDLSDESIEEWEQQIDEEKLRGEDVAVHVTGTVVRDA